MSYSNGYGGYSSSGMYPQNNGFGGGYGGGGGGAGYGGGGGGGYGGGGGGWNGGGGRGRGRRDDRRGGGGGRGGGRGGGQGYGGSRETEVESTERRLKKMIIRFAEEEDFHPIEDPPRLARALRKQWREGSTGIFEGFRVGVTQEPHKHPHFVSLLTHLSRNPSTPRDEDVKQEDEGLEDDLGRKRKAEGGEVECGREVLEDLSKAFRGWVEDRQWLNMRLALSFFSLLVPAGLVTHASLLEVYRSLLAVLEEVGGGGDRAERVIRAVSEGLFRSGSALNDAFPEDVEAILVQLENGIQARKDHKKLNNPFTPVLSAGEESEDVPNQFDDLLNVLQSLRSTSYAPPECLPRYWEQIESADENVFQSDPYHLVSVAMPPEMYDADDSSEGGVEGRAGRLVFFGEEVVASTSTLNGYTLRGLVLDLSTLFEVNRKECAQVLLSLKTFVAPNTFKSTSEESTSTLSLESLIISTLLASMFSLPSSPFPQIYYTGLITELCKASPNTVAPPVGRAVRKMFTWMGTEGLDVEIIRRTADWFATHLSNFGFQWMWKEWIPDLDLPTAHPRRAFMRRVVDLEVRLAYHDRILQSLPEPMLEEGAGVVLKESPDPTWVYEQKDHPLHAEAAELHKLYRGKTPANEIRAHLQTLPNMTSGPGEPIPAQVISMAVETLLHLGSRSFSHFLNATERYLDLLRSLSPDPASRQVVLSAIHSFWSRSGQMRLVTIDKYIQYGVLEGNDVVAWIFSDEDVSGEEADGWTDGHKWEVLRMTLEKHVGRVSAAKRKVRAVEREDEVARARKAAEKLERGEGVGEDENVETAEARLERSKDAREAQISLDIHASKLETIMLDTMRRFVKELLPWRFDVMDKQGLKAVLTLLDSGTEGAWGARFRFGWYREFVRKHAQQLVPLASVINDKTFGSIRGNEESTVEGRAEEMVRAVWTEVLG